MPGPMPKLTKTVIALSLALLGLGPTTAFGQNAASRTYSATAVHGLPGQPETYGRITKSGQNLRLEFNQAGRDVVQILRPEIGAMYVLDPLNKTYMEIRGPAVPAPDSDGYVSPCPGQEGSAQCQRIGEEKISGVSVERWTMTGAQQTKPLVIWWNSPRRRALRQDFPEGGSMVMAFKAMQTLNGRSAEHWTINLTRPGQKTLTGDWWFDPDLRVVVRETLPSGETRRLENIVVGPVDPALFQVPAGWAKREVPSAGLQAPQQTLQPPLQPAPQKPASGN
jgi:hypothetical protein